MTRDEAIEAGAKALWEPYDVPWETADAEGWGYVDDCREKAETVLGAAEWSEPAEPVGYAVVTAKYGVWVAGPYKTRPEAQSIADGGLGRHSARNCRVVALMEVRP